MIDLKNCPFCGNSLAPKVFSASEMWDEDSQGSYPHSESYAVICDASDEARNKGCGGAGGYSVTPEDAIRLWNQRSIDAAMQS